MYRRVKPVTTSATGDAHGQEDLVGTRIPGLPQATRLGRPQHSRGGCSSIPSRHVRGYRAALPTRSPAGPTCGELAGRGGPPARGRMLGDTLVWFPKGKARTSSVASLRRRSRRLPACHDTLPTPGALCLPAIFGSLLRAPLRLLIMRVRNSFGLSYIRKGRGLEAAKYTGACGSERGAFGTACGKEIEQWKDGLTRCMGPRVDRRADGGMDGG